MTLKAKSETRHFQTLELADCKVPIGCPWGCDCPEDAFPDHHGKDQKEPIVEQP